MTTILSRKLHCSGMYALSGNHLDPQLQGTVHCVIVHVFPPDLFLAVFANLLGLIFFFSSVSILPFFVFTLCFFHFFFDSHQKAILDYPFRHSITLCTLLQLYLFRHVVFTLFKVQIYVHFSSLFL